MTTNLTTNLATSTFSNSALSLPQLGWKPFFQQQLTLEEYDFTQPARVMAEHRSILVLATEHGETRLDRHHNMPDIAVGDWLLLDQDQRFHRLLERSSLLSRKAPGTDRKVQLIGANLDTAFIVSSLNHDFNLSRIERYLSIINQAEIEPVIILTKADLCSDPDSFLDQVRNLDPTLQVELVNSLDASTSDLLKTWCNTGKTTAFIGSSGVGKSTLINTLSGHELQKTGGIREDDSKGKHTTRSRALQPLEAGGLLMDTPGMRELQIADCVEGVSETFADIEELALNCRFADCSHQAEPGCAVQQAIESGDLDPRRFKSYSKLLREQAINAQSLADRRADSKALGKFYKRVQADSRRLKQR
ncbi:ribosome small subunit-dependent GTPase A [Sansalvadorimonas sp. 2012CJ34-2]|uniref:Small ribosomal subunit biogenesis GTPase RsgA n=1 Tax=Parendozoicomonas callyspongiae TaxID=2942213 RepID=A0ABT0PC62_9GAMM|nr:ribosome small subunit-dependent GTPase A [Sansalvadorimonas sp. 2012CJ34-2]MCL6268934.1 ribosome small subunit-dependent GTPase A [Sansalvadorimonas sp. 2012CJ34-2]